MHGQTVPSVAMCVGMDSAWTIHTPFEYSSLVCTQDQGQVSGSPQTLHEVHELGPVVLVRLLNSGGEVGRCSASVQPGTIGGKQNFGHQTLEALSLGLVQLLTVLVQHKKIHGGCS